MRNIAALVIAAVALTTNGCSVTLEQAKVKTKPRHNDSAKHLLGSIGKYPEIVTKLADAQAYHETLASRLRERRGKLRSRQRAFSTISFGTFVATTLAIGAVSIVSDDDRAPDTVKVMGGGALAGLAVGTFFQVANLVQEDTSSMDAKLRVLDQSYNAMLGRLREIIRDSDRNANEFKELGKPDKPDKPDKPNPLVKAEMDAAIEAFLTVAKGINIKG